METTDTYMSYTLQIEVDGEWRGISNFLDKDAADAALARLQESGDGWDYRLAERENVRAQF